MKCCIALKFKHNKNDMQLWLVLISTDQTNRRAVASNYLYWMRVCRFVSNNERTAQPYKNWTPLEWKTNAHDSVSVSMCEGSVAAVAAATAVAHTINATKAIAAQSNG